MVRSRRTPKGSLLNMKSFANPILTPLGNMIRRVQCSLYLRGMKLATSRTQGINFHTGYDDIVAQELLVGIPRCVLRCCLSLNEVA